MAAKGVDGLDAPTRKLIESIVKRYGRDHQLAKTMLNQFATVVQEAPDLMKHVHSLRWRTKDPSHLKDKLVRRALKEKQENIDFSVTEENLFEKINDLAGFRILHLHAAQFVEIDAALRGLFSEYRYEVIEEPKARTWDDEYRAFYEEIGVKCVPSPKMYTSIHYVIAPNSATKVTCEVQVRTLAEELWGEVDHTINYPHPSKILACRDQIKVLARMTSSCSRMVDSIFKVAKGAS